MFAVALVQNQSEMAHYGYADARLLVKDMGYMPILYTAANIGDLARVLKDRHVDAVVIASNALNDKTIRSHFEGLELRSALEEFLRSRRGLVCLHQLGLAQSSDGGKLSFLPDALSDIEACPRPPVERAQEGTLTIPTGVQGHMALLYPNEVDAEIVRQQALNFKSLRGVYWHYWANVNLADWDTLVVDASAPSEDRPLVLLTKESADWRIAVSSLTLDWQRHRELLRNILSHIVEDRHTTAILNIDSASNSSFSYLIASLRARQFPFSQYFMDADLSPLARRLRDSVHTTLVIGPHVDETLLSEELRHAILEGTDNGSLRVLRIGQVRGKVREFSIASRQMHAMRLLNSLELTIQGELRGGYIDNSFWGTAETLRILERMPGRKNKYRHLVVGALDRAAAHDRDGSYDEVFGVTCALFWLRATYLGVTHDKTQTTLAWLRREILNHEYREPMFAYLIFAEIGILLEVERDAFIEILNRLELGRLNENDLNIFLQAAITLQHSSIILSLVREIQARQDPQTGAWLDCATTATTASNLLDAMRAVEGDPAAYAGLRSDVEKMVFAAIIYIIDSLNRTESKVELLYPWDGKAATSVKCIEAWLKFEETLDIPVYEIMDSLRTAHVSSLQVISGWTALSVLEELNEENQRLRREAAEDQDDVTAARRAISISRLAVVLGSLSFYGLVTTIIGHIRSSTLKGLGETLKVAFVQPWELHVALLGALTVGGTLGKSLWRKIFRRLAGRHGAA